MLKFHLNREKTCTEANWGTPRLPWCDAWCKLNNIFVMFTETNGTPIRMHSACTMRSYYSLSIHVWMLASAVRTINRVKYMSTLHTYQALLHFDGPTANGSGHSPHCGRSCCTAWLARMSTLVQRIALRLPQCGTMHKSIPGFMHIRGTCWTSSRGIYNTPMTLQYTWS